MDETPLSIHVELRQSRPFPTAAEAAAVGLLRTAEVIRWAAAASLGRHGLTYQQYNVLRILRGARPEPLATLEIASRMIESTPGITRLLDRLEAKGLVLRKRCEQDRRQVHCWITAAGLELLVGLDQELNQSHDAGFSELGEAEIRKLSELLDRVRHSFRRAGVW